VASNDKRAGDGNPGKDGDVDLNELMELEILREVDAEGNPVESAGDRTGEIGESRAMEEELGTAEAEEPDVAELELVPDTEGQLEILTEERDRLREDLLRVQADFINFRKRMEREKSEVVRRASQSLIEELLPVIDNFELALANNDQADFETWREGVRLIHKQFLDLLAGHGLSEVASVGEVFDPNIHEAVAVLSDPEVESNRVVAELKKGYYLRDRLIRSPMVQVVINEDNDTGEDGAAESPETSGTSEN
jgi:molecular chaperone GrpE